MELNCPDPAAAEAAFYRAFQRLDLDAMRAVWLDSAETSCIHPGGGLLLGTAAIIASWAAIFDNSRAPRLTTRLLAAHTDQNLAVHTVAEDIASGSGKGARVIATNTFTRSRNGWRILSHHASLPLVEPSREHTSAVH